MSISGIVTDAVAALTLQLSDAFITVGPFILLAGGGFAAWRYGKRILGKL
jgi:hypothetical protein